jgi:prepilin-type N-terminal cleavage/methylation domain-containing protein
MKREDVKSDWCGERPVTFHVSRFTHASAHGTVRLKGSPGLPPAFTLLEMLLVLALGAVLATAAAVSLASSRRAASAKDVAGQVAHFDRLTREQARRSGRPARLMFDLDRGDLRRTTDDAEDRHDPRAGASALHLVGDARVAKVVRARESATAGQVSVPCSPRGQTPSYAVLLVGPGGQRQWVVVAGLTGQVSTVTDEREVEDIFRTLAGDATEAEGEPR